MDSNLGGKLDTIDSSVGDVETAVNNAKSAITGSISTMDSNLGGKLDTLNAVDFATETTLDAFKSANHSDLVALSSSLDRFGFDAGALIVTGNLNVEVGLTQQDEVTVYQGTNPWIVNDSTVSGALNALGSDLNAFASANHSDLLAIDGSVGDVETAVDNAKSAITGSISTMDSNLGGKLDTLDTSVGAVETAVDNAKSAITGSISTMDSNLGGKLDTLDSSVGDVETAVNNAKSAITGSISTMDSNLGGKLDTLDTSVGDVETAVDNAKSAITGSISTMDSNLGGKLDTLDSSVGDVETAVNNAKSAITGSISTMDSNLGGKLDTLNAVDFATETTLDAFKSANHSDLVALSSSLNRFSFNGSNELLVNAAVDVALSASTDSITIYGDEGVAFAQISGSGELITVPIGNEGNSFLQAASGSIWTDSSGNGALLVGLLGSNSKTILKSSVNDILVVSGAGNFNVVASDLDIRDLSSGTDSVSAVQSGDWTVRKHTTSAAVTTASASSSSAQVLASNAERMGATFFMDGNATCYIKLGGAASTADFSVRLVNNGYYELPEGYTGAIHAIFSVTDAAIKLRITELSYV